MQVKIVIGTIAFMLTMIILGFAALREPARLQEFQHAFEGRSIENGARLFSNNCATCHGVNGKAEECYDAGGNVIGCQGLPLAAVGPDPRTDRGRAGTPSHWERGASSRRPGRSWHS